jgi:hypothetical protein
MNTQAVLAFLHRHLPLVSESSNADGSPSEAIGLPSPAEPEPTVTEPADYPLPGSYLPAVVVQWFDITTQLISQAQIEARQFAVKRAQRIWSTLGRKLQKNTWAIAYRRAHFTPVYYSSLTRRWARITATRRG